MKAEKPGNTALPFFAGVAELADALDSGSSEGNFVQVQVLSPAPFPHLRAHKGYTAKVSFAAEF